MTEKEEELLDRGILPNNAKLSKAEISRWFAGMQNEAEKARLEEVAKVEDIIRESGGNLRSDEVFEAVANFIEFCKVTHWGLFYNVPDSTRFAETLFMDPIGYSSVNQAAGRDYTHSEFYLVACKRDGRQIVDFGFLDGPYNVEVGKGVELEKGCKRKVWRFEVPESMFAKWWSPNSRLDVNSQEFSEGVLRIFVKGHFLKKTS